MTNVPAECLSDDQLQRLLSDDAADEAAESHLALCLPCRERLEAESESDRWKKLLPEKSPVGPDTALGYQPPGASVPEPSDRTANAATTGPDTGGAASDERPPEIPGFTVCERVGSGGMGIVFRAVQHTVNREVAIKTLPATFDQPERRIRLRREAQAAGRLNHPGIVQVIDSGEVSGVAFIVQEYLPDGSLEDRIDGNPWEAQPAAELLSEVTRALAHAHENGVLHRDLKPGNILFRDDQPQLADFGLAKLLDDTQEITATAAAMGTPAYMSPEQASGKSSAIGPKSDIFSLGVILYELLTAVRPFRASTAVETLRLIDELDPVPPRRLVPTIPVDLETICLKCLEKSPDGRYESAQELADDLQRFLSDHPIQARRATLLQKTAKWIRREPGLAALSGILMVAMLGLIGVWARFTAKLTDVNTELSTTNGKLIKANEDLETQTKLAVEKAELAENSLQVANENRRIADDVNTFLQQDLLGQATAGAQMDWLTSIGQSSLNYKRDPTVRDLLLRATERVNSSDALKGQEIVRAELLVTIAEAWHNLGDYGTAISNLQKAEHLFSSADGEHAAALWRCQRLLGNASVAHGQYDSSAEVFSRALDVAAKTFGTASVEFQLTSLDASASVLYRTSKSEEIEAALTDAKKALGFLQELLPANSSEVIRATSLLGHMYTSLERSAEALPLFVAVSEAADIVLGPNHPVSLNARFELGKAYAGNLQYEKAAEIKQDVWQTAAEVLGAEHPTTLVYQFAASDGLRERRQREEGVQLAEDAFEQLESHYPDAHPILMKCRQQLSEAYAFADQHESALRVAQERAAIATREWGPDSKAAVVSDVLVARRLTDAGKGDESLALMKEILSRKHIRERYPVVYTESQRDYGQALEAAGKLDEAEAVLRSAYDDHVELFGIESEGTFVASLTLLNLYRAQGNHEAVVEFGEQVIADSRDRLPPTERTLLALRQFVANSYMYLKNFDRASELTEEDARVYLEKFPEDPTAYFYLSMFAYCQLNKGEHEAALETALRAWKGLEATKANAPRPATHLSRQLQTAGMLKSICDKLNDTDQVAHWQSTIDGLQKEAKQ